MTLIQSPVKCNGPPPLLFPSRAPLQKKMRGVFIAKNVISHKGEKGKSFPFGLVEVQLQPLARTPDYAFVLGI